jgi:hypothetical protein
LLRDSIHFCIQKVLLIDLSWAREIALSGSWRGSRSRAPPGWSDTPAGGSESYALRDGRAGSPPGDGR